MNLYCIEYQHESTGQRLICQSVGVDQDDVITDIATAAGEITVLNLSHLSAVHRLTGSIRKQVIQMSKETQTRSRIGRPRKYDPED